MERLDCTDLTCPMPIVRLGQKVNAMSSGEELTIVATDAAFRADLEAWIGKTGHHLLSLRVDAGKVEAVIRKK